MTDHPKSRRARIISPETVTVPVGRGLIDYPPGWTGPVPAEAADYLAARPHLAEVWRDGEPPAPGAVPIPAEETRVRVIQTEDGPTFEDLDTEEPPPLPQTEAPAASDDLEGEEA